MHYQVEVGHSEPTYTAVIRNRVRPEELSKFVPAACGEVWSFVRSAGLPKPGRHVALYVGDGQGSVEVGAEVGERFAGNDRVQCSQLPAGRVAKAVHFGPYGRLGEAHAAIREWCNQHGHRLSNVSWKSMAIGRKAGTAMPPRYAPMFSICSMIKRVSCRGLTRMNADWVAAKYIPSAPCLACSINKLAQSINKLAQSIKELCSRRCYM